MDEKVVEELEFHQQTVAEPTTNSPLHLIREKEMEISGRVLAAKREADEIVADARKRGCGAAVGSAHDDADQRSQASATTPSRPRCEREIERGAAPRRSATPPRSERRSSAHGAGESRYVIESVTRI